jgi:hypothetical protein
MAGSQLPPTPDILQTAVSSVKVCLAVRLTAVILYGMTVVQSLHILVSVFLNRLYFVAS